MEHVARARDARGTDRIIAVSGASGVGKTSLLAAGLIPALQRSEPRTETVQMVTLGTDPVNDLAEVLATTRALRDAATVRAREPLEHRDAKEYLVIIDQFERFFAAPIDRDTRETVLASVRCLADIAVVLISLRTNCISNCTDHPILIDTIKHRGYLLETMKSDELRAAASGLAHQCGIGVETGLEEVLLAAIEGIRSDTGRLGHEPGELAVLSQTMKMMWPQRENARFTVGSYRRIGGVEGAVHAAAHDVWNCLSQSQRSTARRILLGLVSVRSDADDARRRLSGDELRRLVGREPGAQAVLDALIDGRIVTMDWDETYLSHDLILTWEPLADWLYIHRPVLLVQRRTAVDASEWNTADRHSSLLYRGRRLATAMKHIDTNDDVVTEFLHESIQSEKRERTASAATP